MAEARKDFRPAGRHAEARDSEEPETQGLKAPEAPGAKGAEKQRLMRTGGIGAAGGARDRAIPWLETGIF